MTASFVLKLDTSGPGGVAASIASGAAATGTRDVPFAVTTTDPDTTGYQVKVWGDVDPAFAAEIQATEGASSWIALGALAAGIRLSAGDGTKTVNAKLRDDVWNEAGAVLDTIVLDSTAPTVALSAGPTPAKISKVGGKNTSDITWASNEDVVEYKVKVVANGAAAHNTGAQIPITGGSSNVAAVTNIAAGVPTTTTIKGADLEAAGGEGDNTVKVFTKDAQGNWSA